MALFVGLTLPPDVAERLSWLGGGIRGARWEPAEKLHLTLRYLGDVEGLTRRAVEQALAEVVAPPFELAVQGVGHFPPRGEPRSVWAGVADPSPVTALAHRIDAAVSATGVEPERRKFAPHITLARLKRPRSAEVADFLTRHALLQSPTFVVDAFALVSSIRSARGSKYATEGRYPLRG